MEGLKRRAGQVDSRGNARGMVHGHALECSYSCGHRCPDKVRHRLADACPWSCCRLVYELITVSCDARPANTPCTALQGFLLGQQLSKTYGHWLPGGAPCPKEAGVARSSVHQAADAITVHSTDYDRTVDTVNSLLLGFLLPSGTKASASMPECSCRPDHGARSEPSCIAECLNVDAVDGMPYVDVVPKTGSASDAAAHFGLYQSDECTAWQTWRTNVESNADWLGLPDGRFHDAMQLAGRMVNGNVVQKKAWPGGEVQETIDITAADFDRVSFLETVRFR
jgi:hypothetical protein